MLPGSRGHFLTGYLNSYQDEWNEAIIGKSENRNNGHPLAGIGGCLVIILFWTMLLFSSRSDMVLVSFDPHGHSGLG